MDAVTIGELAHVIGAECGNLDGLQTFTSVSTDTRTLSEGDVFWALSGPNFDGHDFIAGAIDSGAAAVVCSHDGSADSPSLRVTDVRRALWDFATWYRGTLQGTVVGITGSVGKTTTRQMIHDVLNSRYVASQSPANFNNHFGVPLSILSASSEDDFVVLELGASAVGEIAELSSLAAPEIGVITNIAAAHLAGFGSLDGVRQAKGELIESLPDVGIALLNGDDPRVREAAGRAACEVRFFGESEHAEIRATSVLTSEDELEFQVDGEYYHLTVSGRHYLTSALAAIAVAREAGMLPAEIQQGFRAFEPVSGRCNVLSFGDATVIDDTYNASPLSVAAAVKTLSGHQRHAQRVLILGDMAELGEDASDIHHATGAACATTGIDLILAHGLFAPQIVAGVAEAGGPQAIAFEELDQLNAVLREQLKPNAAVLVKGSRSSRMERVVDFLKSHLTSDASASDET